MILKANGPSVAVIHFDPAKIASRRREEIDQLAYHVARLLAGEGTAESEWRHLDMSIEVEPDSDGGPEG